VSCLYYQEISGLGSVVISLYAGECTPSVANNKFKFVKVHRPGDSEVTFFGIRVKHSSCHLLLPV